MTSDVNDFEIMRLGDSFTSPEGIVLGGTNKILDEWTVEEVNALLRNIHSVEIAKADGTRHPLKVLRTSMTESAAGKRNFFLLVPSDTSPSVVEISASVFCRVDLPTTRA